MTDKQWLGLTLVGVFIGAITGVLVSNPGWATGPAVGSAIGGAYMCLASLLKGSVDRYKAVVEVLEAQNKGLQAWKEQIETAFADRDKSLESLDHRVAFLEQETLP